MRVTLIHNSAAGEGDAPNNDEVVAALEALGWTVKAATPDELEAALGEPGDAVLVAGGDGTIGKVAKRLAGGDLPIGIVPMGTANNVARSLGLGVDARSAIPQLARAQVRRVDLGVVRDANGNEHRFLEGVGVGLFASVMAERATEDHKTMRGALALLADRLESYVPDRVELAVEGVDRSGDYLIAAVMNLRSVGPALGLAPDAMFDDGLLDVVLVPPAQRDPLLAHLRRGAAGGDAPLPRFEVHRASHVALRTGARWSHIDDRSHVLDGEVTLRASPRTIPFLIP